MFSPEDIAKLHYWPKNRIFNRYGDSFDIPRPDGFEVVMHWHMLQMTVSVLVCEDRSHLHVVAHSCGLFYSDIYHLHEEYIEQFWSDQETKTRILGEMTMKLMHGFKEAHGFYFKQQLQQLERNDA